MRKSLVSIVRYQRPADSVREAVELCAGFADFKRGDRVFVKPNIVCWTRKVSFPKWGVITTSRVVEDVVVLLKELGAGAIVIGEGTVTHRPGDTETPAHAFETLGYNTLGQRYGVRVVNLFERPFRKVDLGAGVELNFAVDFLESDFLVNLPVLKCHAQTVVSLGIKNLKGLLDIPSRKACHKADPARDLHFMVSRLQRALPPSLTVVDGIFSLERGPMYDGSARRTNLVVASSDPVSADLVGARLLGYDPGEVPHLALAATDRGRPADLSDLQIRGERLETAASRHEYDFPYTEDGSLPKPMEKMGIRGLSYRKYDLSMCTYCSHINGVTLWAISRAWKGQPWDDVEILTGKTMRPTPGKRKTVLLGRCMDEANRDHPHIRERIVAKGCPPTPASIARALRQAGIEVDPRHLERIEEYPGFFQKRYEGRPEFDESFFRVG